MLTFHILNVYVDKNQPRQFKFTFNIVCLKPGSIRFELKCLAKQIKYETKDRETKLPTLHGFLHSHVGQPFWSSNTPYSHGPGHGRARHVGHTALHSASVSNLLALPWQPPYVNSSHVPELTLKNQREKEPLHGPGNLGRLHIAIKQQAFTLDHKNGREVEALHGPGNLGRLQIAIKQQAFTLDHKNGARWKPCTDLATSAGCRLLSNNKHSRWITRTGARWKPCTDLATSAGCRLLSNNKHSR